MPGVLLLPGLALLCRPRQAVRGAPARLTSLEFVSLTGFVCCSVLLLQQITEEAVLQNLLKVRGRH